MAIIDIDDYDYRETVGFDSAASHLLKDHIELHKEIDENTENDKHQEIKISANTIVNAEQEVEIKTNKDVNDFQELEIQIISGDLITEIARAKQAEEDEYTRAITAEQNEFNRAVSAETILRNDLNTEITRAKKAENDEYIRATSAETNIREVISAEVATHKSDIDLIDRTFTNVNAAIENVKTQLDAHTAQYNYLKDSLIPQKIADSEEKITDKFNKNLSTINDEITDINKEIEDLKRRVTALENK